MPRSYRVIKCAGCGAEVTLLLAGLDPAECRQCGVWYDQRTGEMLPVCPGIGYQVPESGSTDPAID